MRASTPSTRCIPSAAIDVTTTGRPWAMAWLTLPLTPAPKRNGAIDTRDASMRGPRSATRPWIVTPSTLSAALERGSISPTTCNVIEGSIECTCGNISRTNHCMASAFGGCPNPPTKRSPERSSKSSMRPTGSWILLTTSTCAPGRSVARMRRSSSLTTNVKSQRDIASCSRRRDRFASLRMLERPLRSAARPSLM